MKLKTLKDLDKVCSCGSSKESHEPHLVSMYTLKAEAVKWVKEARSRRKNSNDKSHYALSLVAHWFMEFHNLTEDDLA